MIRSECVTLGERVNKDHIKINENHKGWCSFSGDELFVYKTTRILVRRALAISALECSVF